MNHPNPDYSTNTIDGAADHAATYTKPVEEPEYENEDYYAFDLNTDECNCSDWDCPCSGHKTGQF